MRAGCPCRAARRRLVGAEQGADGAEQARHHVEGAIAVGDRGGGAVRARTGRPSGRPVRRRARAQARTPARAGAPVGVRNSLPRGTASRGVGVAAFLGGRRQLAHVSLSVRSVSRHEADRQGRAAGQRAGTGDRTAPDERTSRHRRHYLRRWGGLLVQGRSGKQKSVRARSGQAALLTAHQNDGPARPFKESGVRTSGHTRESATTASPHGSARALPP